MYETGARDVQWQTCAVAKGPVRVMVLHYRDMRDLIAKRPEVEADLRAGNCHAAGGAYLRRRRVAGDLVNMLCCWLNLQSSVAAAAQSRKRSLKSGFISSTARSCEPI